MALRSSSFLRAYSRAPRHWGIFGSSSSVTEHDDAHPLLRTYHLVCFDADLGVSAHPLDLLPDGGEAIQSIHRRRQINRHDLWLALVGARQSAESARASRSRILLPLSSWISTTMTLQRRPQCGGVYLRCRSLRRGGRLSKADRRGSDPLFGSDQRQDRRLA